MEVEHYIISSGIKPIIEGTSIARHFKQIFACDFVYDESGKPEWPAIAVNYTSKLQFLYRINKGIWDIWDNKRLKADYSEGSELEEIAKMILLKIRTESILERITERHAKSVSNI